MNIFERRAELIAKRAKKREEYEELKIKISNRSSCSGSTVSQTNLILGELLNIKEQISLTEGIIAGYALFSPEEIVPVLEDVISCSEGSKYSFCASYRIDEDKKRKICLIVDENDKKDEYTSFELEILKHEKKALVFPRISSAEYLLGFYPYNFDLKNECNLEDFPFVKSFIDEVICYKEENKIHPSMLDSETIDRLKEEFILRNVDNFVNYHALRDSKDEEKKAKLEDQIKGRKAYQKRLIDLKKANTDN